MDMMRFEKNIADRKKLARRLGELTGIAPHYTKMPRCAYEVGAYTVERDGSLTVGEDAADAGILDALKAEGLIKAAEGTAQPETVEESVAAEDAADLEEGVQAGQTETAESISEAELPSGEEPSGEAEFSVESETTEDSGTSTETGTKEETEIPIEPDTTGNGRIPIETDTKGETEILTEPETAKNAETLTAAESVGEAKTSTEMETDGDGEASVEAEIPTESAGTAGTDQLTGDSLDSTAPEESEAPAGAKSTLAGFAVSLPVAGHTGNSLRNLVNMVYSRGPLLSKATGGSFRVGKGLADALQEDSGTATADGFLKAVAEYAGAHGDCIEGIEFSGGKISFTGFPVPADKEHADAFCQLAAMMNGMALSQKRI